MTLGDAVQLWNSAWPAGVIMLGLGLGFAVVLLVAREKLKVQVDPKLEQVHAALPHLDCGGCGFVGCWQYAKALLEDPLLIGRCGPGGPTTAENVAHVLNVQISDSGPPKRPIVHCRAHRSDRTYQASYNGLPSCTAANALSDAQACHFGCLGFGDCTRACKFDALHVVDGLATVDYHKCTGCAACSRTCPRGLIVMVAFSHENMMAVACRSRETGKATRSMCRVGCIACGLCVKQSETFSVEDNLAHIDHAKYAPSAQNEAALTKCPTGVIVYRGKTAPAPRQPKAKEPAATGP